MKILPKKATDHLVYHILDGNEATIAKLRDFRDSGQISKEKYYEWLDKQVDHFRYRVKEWRLREKLFSFTFIILFTYLQALNMTGDMVRRTGRKGRRRDETEFTIPNGFGLI
jgi:hypothetical protein